MAVQARMYPDNLGMPFCGSQDWGGGVGGGAGGFDFDADLGFNLSQQKYPQLLQQQPQPQLQQHYLLQLQNQQQQLKNQFLALGNNNFVFSATKNGPTSIAAAPTTSINTIDNTGRSGSNGRISISTAFSQSIAAQMDKQRLEIDRYINLQCQRMKLASQEQRKQQLSTILRKLESRASILLRQKDEHIEQTTKRALELEDFMRKVEEENQAWKRIAGENEAMIVKLNTTLEQLRERRAMAVSFNGCDNAGGVEDAESCCEENAKRVALEKGEGEEGNGGVAGNEGEWGREEGTGERVVRHGEKRRRLETSMGRHCRACKSGNLCVMFLPCRHLCSCKACEAFLDACPVCNSPKAASIEALFS